MKNSVTTDRLAVYAVYVYYLLVSRRFDIVYNRWQDELSEQPSHDTQWYGKSTPSLQGIT